MHLLFHSAKTSASSMDTLGARKQRSGAVRLVGLLSDDTSVDQSGVAPVVLLDTLTVNWIHGVGDGSPERATSKVLLPCVTLGVEQQLAGSEGVVVLGLQRPLSDESGELARDGLEVSALAADSRRNVLGVGAGGGEVVDVGIDHEILGGVEKRSPVVGALEVVLKHDGDAFVELLDFLEDAVHVCQDPVRTSIGQTGRRTEASEMGVGCLVDGTEGESVLVARVLDELEDLVDSGESVVEVGGVLEPVAVAESLANVEAVHATWERVKTDDDVHVVLLDSILCDGAEVLLLVTSIKLRSRNLDPSGVGGGDTKSIHTDRGKLVDGRGVEE
jgi:hypothetical protein